MQTSTVETAETPMQECRHAVGALPSTGYLGLFEPSYLLLAARGKNVLLIGAGNRDPMRIALQAAIP